MLHLYTPLKEVTSSSCTLEIPALMLCILEIARLKSIDTLYCVEGSTVSTKLGLRVLVRGVATTTVSEIILVIYPSKYTRLSRSNLTIGWFGPR